MEIEIYDLVQECCDKEKKYRKFTKASPYFIYLKKKKTLTYLKN